MNVDVFHDLVPHLQGQLTGECGSAVKLKLANKCNYTPPMTQYIELPGGNSNNGDAGIGHLRLFPNRKQNIYFQEKSKGLKQTGCGN